MALSSETKPIRISEGLGAEHYERIAKKIVDQGIPDRWCTAAYECACAGCANRKLSWAEYECWKKYNPEFNKISQKGSQDGA